jgi:hypothetical protein
MLLKFLSFKKAFTALTELLWFLNRVFEALTEFL